MFKCRPKRTSAFQSLESNFLRFHQNSIEHLSFLLIYKADSPSELSSFQGQVCQLIYWNSICWGDKGRLAIKVIAYNCDIIYTILLFLIHNLYLMNNWLSDFRLQLDRPKAFRLIGYNSDSVPEVLLAILFCQNNAACIFTTKNRSDSHYYFLFPTWGDGNRGWDSAIHQISFNLQRDWLLNVRILHLYLSSNCLFCFASNIDMFLLNWLLSDTPDFILKLIHCQRIRKD